MNYDTEHYLDVLRRAGAIITPQAAAEARKTLDVIREHPEQHDQNTWMSLSPEQTTGVPLGKTLHFTGEEAFSCGTAMCFAGFYAALLAEESMSCAVGFGQPKMHDGQPLDDWVANRLGLPRYGSSFDHMFDSSNDLPRLEAWVEAMQLRSDELLAQCDTVDVSRETSPL